LLGVPDSHYPRTCPLSPDTMRTYILVLYGTGLRLGEVSRLTHADADLRNATLLIRETKFGKSRLVPIGKDLVSILRLYRMRHRPGVGYQRPPTLLATKIGMMIRNDHADHQFEWLRKEAGVLRFDTARYQPRVHDFRQHADSPIMPTTPQGQGVGGARVVSGFGIIRGFPGTPEVCHQGGIVLV